MELSPLRTLSRSLTATVKAPVIPCSSKFSSPVPASPAKSALIRVSGGLISQVGSQSGALVGGFGVFSSGRRSGSCSKGRSGAVAGMAGSVDVGKGVELKVYEDSGELGHDLAPYVAGLSESAISERGAFSVVLSGGSLISTLGKLTEEPYVGKIDWTRWHVFWVDERVVPLDHPDSNYKLAYDGLLSKVGIPPGQVYAINDKLSPVAAAQDYEFCLRHLVKTGVLPLADTGDYPRFDLLLLGMGPDGHIASLFPHHPLVNKKEVWIAAIEDSPKPPPERITFTLPVINSGANVAFVATGSGKADKLKLIFGEKLPFGELPAQLVDPYKGKLVWFVDKAAVSKM